jgi:hypothetical protein
LITGTSLPTHDDRSKKKKANMASPWEKAPVHSAG